MSYLRSGSTITAVWPGLLSDPYLTRGSLKLPLEKALTLYIGPEVQGKVSLVILYSVCGIVLLATEHG